MTVVEDIEEHRKNTKWINNNYGRLAEDYDKKYIAVWQQKIAASGKTIESIKDQINKNDKIPGLDKMVIEYIEKNPTKFIG